jgi:hypothetical protein
VRACAVCGDEGSNGKAIDRPLSGQIASGSPLA